MGGAAGKELYGDVEGGRSGAEGHLGRFMRSKEGGGAPVSGFINRSLSLLSAGIPFQFLSHLKIQQGWKRKDKIWVLYSSDRIDDAAKISIPVRPPCHV